MCFYNKKGPPLPSIDLPMVLRLFRWAKVIVKQKTDARYRMYININIVRRSVKDLEGTIVKHEPVGWLIFGGFC